LARTASEFEKRGPNKIQVTDITMQLEPDSVILRDPSGKHPIQVLEQNYRAFRVFAAFAQKQDGSISWCSARTSRKS